MKHFFVICFVGIFSLFFSGCTGDTSEKNNEESTNIEIAENEFFLPLLPQDWNIFSPEYFQEENIFFMASEPFVGNTIETLFTASKYELPFSSLESVVDRSLENIRKKSQDFSLTQKESFSLAKTGEKAVFVSYSERINGYTPVEFFALYTVAKEKNEIHVATFLFDANGSDDHKNFLRNILESYNPYGAEKREIE